MEQNLLEKTGKTLEEWKKELATLPYSKHGEFMNYLKKDKGISHGYANFITLKYRETDAGSSDAGDLLAKQYQNKASLKPIYDELIKQISSFGDDIEVAPKKAAVSLRVKRQFALIQPSTKTRIDIGLKFDKKPHEGRLESSGPFGTMCTHRVQITDIEQVDEELLNWLLEAYQQAR